MSTLDVYALVAVVLPVLGSLLGSAGLVAAMSAMDPYQTRQERDSAWRYAVLLTVSLAVLCFGLGVWVGRQPVAATGERHVGSGF